MDHVDTAFFSIDSGVMRQTIAAVCLLDGAPDWGSVESRVRSVLDAFPRLRDKVVRKPRLAWQPDADFDLANHIESVHSSDIQGAEDLFAEAGKIFSKPLNMSRPPWRLVLVAGDNNTACVVLCVHHGVADGVRVIGLLDAITSDSPSRSEPLVTEPEEIFSPPRNGWRDKLGHVLKCSKKLLSESLVPCAGSPLNGPTSGQRAIATVDFPRRELAQMMRQVNGTLHDVLYTIIAGALRLYHEQHRVPNKDMRVIVPMAVPPRSSKGGLGNHLVLSALSLPVSESNVLKRLKRVQEVFSSMKRDGTIAAYEFAAAVIYRFVPRPLHRGVWESVIKKTNLVCTILLGPQSVRYLGGARIDGLYGVPAPVAGHGVALAFVSYAGRVCGSTVTDNKVLPSGREIVECLHTSYRELFSSAIGEAEPVHPLLGHALPSPGHGVVFEAAIPTAATPYLGDYSVGDCPIVPAGALLEMMLAAVWKGGSPRAGGGAVDARRVVELARPKGDDTEDAISGILLEELVIRRPLLVSGHPTQTVQITVVQQDGPWFIRVSSLERDETWTARAESIYQPGAEVPPSSDTSIAELLQKCPQAVPVAEFYHSCRDFHVDYGTGLRVLCQLWRGENESLGLVELPDSLRDVGEYLIHPVLLESCLQVAMTGITNGTKGKSAWMDSVKRICVYDRPGSQVWSHATYSADERGMIANVRLLTPEGRCVVSLDRLRLLFASQESLFEQTATPLNLPEQIQNATITDRRKVVLAHVRRQVASVLGWSTAAQIRMRDRLIDLGIDSMMAVELHDRLQRSTQLALSQTLVFDYPTVEALTDYLYQQIETDWATQPRQMKTADPVDDDLSSLSEAELADLLSSELD
jgi:diacylglycerol O-acyltransferase